MKLRVALLLTLLLGFGLISLAQEMTISPIGTYATGVFDEGAAEIGAYDPATKRFFITNGNDKVVDVIDLNDPTNPTLLTQISIEMYGSGLTSVAIRNGVLAVAVEGEEVDSAGMAVFFSTETYEVLAAVTVGVLPDHIGFNADGTIAVTANEGQPSDDYSIDPEGSVSIIDLSGGAAALTDANVTTVGFGDFNADGPRAAELSADVRIFGPNATVAQDLEPEYIAFSPDGTILFVTLQENNALAAVDVAGGTVLGILPLGFKDHSAEGNGIDASNEDGGINIANWPVLGMYQPDSIASYEVGGEWYLVTANEGDARDYETFGEEVDVADLTLDAEAFPNAAELQQEANLGKLEVTNTLGDTDGDGDWDQIYLFGARSFTIWNALTGEIVFDSGDDFEQITAETYPDFFNSSNDGTELDDRSDNKGPEPEGLTLGVVGEKTYAFIGLERIGGVMIYDITDPANATFVAYVNNRDFAGDPEASAAGDLGPEGLVFIRAEDSATGNPLLVVTNEVSGSTTIYEIK